MITATTETKAYVSRRRFIQLASSGLIAAPMAHLLATSVAAWPPQNPTPEKVLAGAPAKLSWKTVIASAGEPGEPLVVSGTIYGPNGKDQASFCTSLDMFDAS
jgi:hypothetical protein